MISLSTSSHSESGLTSPKIISKPLQEPHLSRIQALVQAPIKCFPKSSRILNAWKWHYPVISFNLEDLKNFLTARLSERLKEPIECFLVGGAAHPFNISFNDLDIAIYLTKRPDYRLIDQTILEFIVEQMGKEKTKAEFTPGWIIENLYKHRHIFRDATGALYGIRGERRQTGGLDGVDIKILFKPERHSPSPADGAQVSLKDYTLRISLGKEFAKTDEEFQDAMRCTENLFYKVLQPENVKSLFFRLLFKISQFHTIEKETLEVAKKMVYSFLQTAKGIKDLENDLRKHQTNHFPTTKGKIIDFLNLLFLFSEDIYVCQFFARAWLNSKEELNLGDEINFAYIIIQRPWLFYDLLSFLATQYHLSPEKTFFLCQPPIQTQYLPLSLAENQIFLPFFYPFFLIFFPIRSEEKKGSDSIVSRIPAEQKKTTSEAAVEQPKKLTTQEKLSNLLGKIEKFPLDEQENMICENLKKIDELGLAIELLQKLVHSKRSEIQIFVLQQLHIYIELDEPKLFTIFRDLMIEASSLKSYEFDKQVSNLIDLMTTQNKKLLTRCSQDRFIAARLLTAYKNQPIWMNFEALKAFLEHIGSQGNQQIVEILNLYIASQPFNGQIVSLLINLLEKNEKLTEESLILWLKMVVFPSLIPPREAQAGKIVEAPVEGVRLLTLLAKKGLANEIKKQLLHRMCKLVIKTTIRAEALFSIFSAALISILSEEDADKLQKIIKTKDPESPELFLKGFFGFVDQFDPQLVKKFFVQHADKKKLRIKSSDEITSKLTHLLNESEQYDIEIVDKLVQKLTLFLVRKKELNKLCELIVLLTAHTHPHSLALATQLFINGVDYSVLKKEEFRTCSLLLMRGYEAVQLLNPDADHSLNSVAIIKRIYKRIEDFAESDISLLLKLICQKEIGKVILENKEIFLIVFDLLMQVIQSDDPKVDIINLALSKINESIHAHEISEEKITELFEILLKRKTLEKIAPTISTDFFVELLKYRESVFPFLISYFYEEQKDFRKGFEEFKELICKTIEKCDDEHVFKNTHSLFAKYQNEMAQQIKTEKLEEEMNQLQAKIFCFSKDPASLEIVCISLCKEKLDFNQLLDLLLGIESLPAELCTQSLIVSLTKLLEKISKLPLCIPENGMTEIHSLVTCMRRVAKIIYNFADSTHSNEIRQLLFVYQAILKGLKIEFDGILIFAYFKLSNDDEQYDINRLLFIYENFVKENFKERDIDIFQQKLDSILLEEHRSLLQLIFEYSKTATKLPSTLSKLELESTFEFKQKQLILEKISDMIPLYSKTFPEKSRELLKGMWDILSKTEHQSFAKEILNHLFKYNHLLVLKRVDTLSIESIDEKERVLVDNEIMAILKEIIINFRASDVYQNQSEFFCILNYLRILTKKINENDLKGIEFILDQYHFFLEYFFMDFVLYSREIYHHIMIDIITFLNRDEKIAAFILTKKNIFESFWKRMLSFLLIPKVLLKATKKNIQSIPKVLKDKNKISKALSMIPKEHLEMLNMEGDFVALSNMVVKVAKTKDKIAFLGCNEYNFFVCDYILKFLLILDPHYKRYKQYLTGKTLKIDDLLDWTDFVGKIGLEEEDYDRFHKCYLGLKQLTAYEQTKEGKKPKKKKKKRKKVDLPASSGT